MSAAGNLADPAVDRSSGGNGSPTGDPWPRRAARTLLRRAVRGRADRGSEWGEAMLAEFEETHGWESVHWSMSGAFASWRQRRGGRSLLAGLGFLVPRRPDARLALVTVLASMLTAVALRMLVMAVYIPSMNMEPGLAVGDRYLFDRVGFRFGELSPGDVVTHTEKGQRSVRRIVGIGGDRIDCPGDVLHRNGAPVDEPYLAPGTVTRCDPVTVPAGSLYLLGDNREVSSDSRHDGPVAADTIDGRLMFRLWPVIR